MGVGSQRKQLRDPGADQEWRAIRSRCPRVRFFGNIGIAQVIESKVDEIRRLVDTLEAEALFVHLNALQECLQPEGTPKFKGGLEALKNLVRSLGVPVIVKETGSGIGAATLQRLNGIGLHAVDVSGYGGTHWGRVEGGRSVAGSMKSEAALAFAQWGIGTVESLACGRLGGRRLPRVGVGRSSLGSRCRKADREGRRARWPCPADLASRGGGWREWWLEWRGITRPRDGDARV